MRIIYIVLVLIVWVIVGAVSCIKQRDCCQEEKTNYLLSDSGVLDFNHGETTPIPGSSWPDKRQELVSSVNPDNPLQLVGLYSLDEPFVPVEFDNLGLYRANETRKLIPEISDSLVTLSSRVIDFNSAEIPLSKSMIDFVLIPKLDAEPEVEETPESLESIVEFNPGDLLTITFPYGSSQAEIDSESQLFLNNLAEYLKASEASITITGHSDNRGSDALNDRLSLERANDIKNRLVSIGVNPDQISTVGKGKREPIATNETAAGRAQNRRIEIAIN